MKNGNSEYQPSLKNASWLFARTGATKSCVKELLIHAEDGHTEIYTELPHPLMYHEIQHEVLNAILNHGRMRPPLQTCFCSTVCTYHGKVTVLIHVLM